MSMNSTSPKTEAAQKAVDALMGKKRQLQTELINHKALDQDFLVAQSLADLQTNQENLAVAVGDLDDAKIQETQQEFELEVALLRKAQRCHTHSDFVSAFKNEIREATSNKPFDVQGLYKTEGLLAASNDLYNRTNGKQQGLTENQLLSIAPKLDTPLAQNEMKNNPKKLENEKKLDSCTGLLTEGLCKLDGQQHTKKEACQIFKDHPEKLEQTQKLFKDLHLKEYYKHSDKEYQQMHEELQLLKTKDPEKAKEVVSTLKALGKEYGDKDPAKLAEIEKKSNMSDKEFDKWKGLVDNYKDWYSKNYDASGKPLENAQTALAATDVKTAATANKALENAGRLPA